MAADRHEQKELFILSREFAQNRGDLPASWPLGGGRVGALRVSQGAGYEITADRSL